MSLQIKLAQAIVACGVVALTFGNLSAQRHELINGREAPGSAARKMLLSKPQLASYSQPIELIAPEGTTLSVGSNGGFGPEFGGRLIANLNIGPVYRLKVSNLPLMPGVREGLSVYPSIEMLDRLYPPEGLKQQFPVQIVLTKDDLKMAATGKLVTKVIYLEDPQTALPIRQPKDNQSTIDIGMSGDAYRTADRLGRPMAIVRIGSRVPLASDLTDEFQFNAPIPEVYPGNQQELMGSSSRPYQSSTDRSAATLNQSPALHPRELPPIVRPTRKSQSPRIIKR